MCLQGIPGERGDFVILRVHSGENGTFYYFKGAFRGKGDFLLLKGCISRERGPFIILRLHSGGKGYFYYFKGAFRGKGDFSLF